MNDRLVSSDVRKARERLSQLGRWYASRPPGGDPLDLDTLIAADRSLEETARTARIDLIVEVDRRAGPFDARLLSALLDVPRERFVRPWDIAESAIDTPLLLDDEGLATISAPHAYLLSFKVLGLKPGIAWPSSGRARATEPPSPATSSPPSGSVLSVEIDEGLARRASHHARGLPQCPGHAAATPPRLWRAGVDSIASR